MRKQTLISIEQPLKLSLNADVDTSAWEVSMLCGPLEGWRDLTSEAADIAWRDAAYVVRAVAANDVGGGETIYAIAIAAADELMCLLKEWRSVDYWVSPPNPGIPKNTLEHDIVALKSSPFPPSEFVPGDVYRKIQSLAFPDEEWWPTQKHGGIALTFPASADEYRERLENDLRLKNYGMARKLVLYSPKGGQNADVNTFKKNPEFLDSVNLYMTGSAMTRSIVNAHFYSRRIGLDKFIDSAVGILTSAGYECYISKGLETFMEWAATGKLPRGLETFPSKL